MILYHFTHPGTVLRIAVEGLKPGEADHMTNGKPVVWLTRQLSNVVTADDVAHVQRLGCLDRTEGDLIFGGKARLAVQLRGRKRLMQYQEFLLQQGLHDMMRRMTPTALTQWYIYFGFIPQHKIDCTMPASIAIECSEHHIATHPDPEARERFKAMRAQIATLPPDRLVSFDLR